jgi:hypothetical protein
VPHFPKLPESDPRKGFLKPETYPKLLFELPEELRLLFVMAYHVGLRRGALLRIKWSQVDTEAGCIWMDGRKANRKPEPVAAPIYGNMGNFLEMQAKTSEYVFVRGSEADLGFPRELEAGLPARRCSEPAFSRPSSYCGSKSTPGQRCRNSDHEDHRSPDEKRSRTYNITDHSDIKEAGRMAEEFLAREQEDLAQSTSHEKERVN